MVAKTPCDVTFNGTSNFYAKRPFVCLHVTFHLHSLFCACVFKNSTGIKVTFSFIDINLVQGTRPICKIDCTQLNGAGKSLMMAFFWWLKCAISDFSCFLLNTRKTLKKPTSLRGQRSETTSAKILLALLPVSATVGSKYDDQ